MVLACILLAGAGLAVSAYLRITSQSQVMPDGIVSGNGRIEADQMDVSTKTAGRVREVLAQEGQSVVQGQLLAQMDTTELQAQRAKYFADQTAAEALILESKAIVSQRQAELKWREDELRRVSVLVSKGTASVQERDQATSQRDSALAIYEAAKSNVSARIRAAEAAKALVALTDVQISDAELRAPAMGRVLYRLANPGEVLGAGGKVLTIIDLTDVYMEIYLPSAEAMQVAIGSDARILIDGSDYVIPAEVSFVSPEAQFTPKQVETRSERDKLMFRVKLRIPHLLVSQYLAVAKTGIRGTGYVRLGLNPPDWPESMRVLIPEEPMEEK